MIVGIDVSKGKLDLAVFYNGKYRTEQFVNKLSSFKILMQWCLAKAKGQTPEFCLEPTGRYGEALTDWLCDQGITVRIVDPSQIHNFRKALKERSKTDAADAILICQFAEKHETRVFHPLSPAMRALRSMTRRREELVAARTQELNRQQECSSKAFEKVSRASLKASVEWHDKEIAKIEDNIKKLLESDPALLRNEQLLNTIPGIAFITAFKLLAEIPPEIDSVKSLDEYAGMVPHKHESGKKQHKPHISKSSNERIRTALFPAAMTVIRYEGPFKALFDRLMNREGQQLRMIALVAVMRKLLHVVLGVLKNQQPFNPDLVTKQTRNIA